MNFSIALAVVFGFIESPASLPALLISLIISRVKSLCDS